MIRHASTTLCLLLAVALTGGCLQRSDGDLAVTVPNGEVNWELVGTFGAAAHPPAEDTDPAAVGVLPGEFLLISGLSAGKDHVYVTDLQVSRIQVFDFNGNYIDSIGSGQLTSVAPSDERIYYEMTDIDKTKEQYWEDTAAAQPWLSDPANYFKAADVQVVDDGLWIADQVRSSGRTRPKRTPGIVFLGNDGTVDASFTRREFVWPDFISIEDRVVCFTETRGNALVLAQQQSDYWAKRSPSGGVHFRDLMRIEREHKGTEAYIEMLLSNSNADVAPGKFNGLGGICLAFDKLVACDIGNGRLQVFEARSTDPMKWAQVIRIIDMNTPNGQLRFESCNDIDIAADGTMFVLDGRRREIAVLDPKFERLGAFGRGDMIEPHAIDLSDDAQHLFVTDRSTNTILHYARRD